MSLQVTTKTLNLNPNVPSDFTLFASKATTNNYPYILFKIKSNKKEEIEVKPSFGILDNQENSVNSKINIFVKYNEKEENSNIKLQIKWTGINQKVDLKDKDQFKKIYREKQKQCQQIIVSVIVNKKQSQKLDSQNVGEFFSPRVEDRSPKISTLSSSKKQDNVNRGDTGLFESIVNKSSNYSQQQVEEVPLKNSKIVKTEQRVEKNIQQPKKMQQSFKEQPILLKETEPAKFKFSLLQLAILTIVILSFGILLGMKIQKLKGYYLYPQETQL